VVGETLRIVACRILDYLVQHPNAYTVDAVVEWWWLLDRFSKSNAGRVKTGWRSL